MSERIPTDVLADQARDEAEILRAWAKGQAGVADRLEAVGRANMFEALADRLAEKGCASPEQVVPRQGDDVCPGCDLGIVGERIPTAADLAERARRLADAYPGLEHSGLRSDLADFAHRLADLAALEPVGRVLAALEAAVGLVSMSVRRLGPGSFEARATVPDGDWVDEVVSEDGTPLAALAALAEAMEGRP